jgi:hypothetical protein
MSKSFEDLETILASVAMGLVWGVAALLNLKKRRLREI